MATLTPNLSLRKPAGSDTVNVTTDISDNMDLLDTAVAGKAATGHNHAGTYEPAGTVATHEADTTSVHGIANTSALATTTNLTDHANDTTSIHGIADTSLLATLANLTVVTANRQTDSYTLVLGDAGKAIEMDKATANTLTVPPNADVAFPTGTILEGCQYGAGQTTITPGAGVTIRASGGKLKTTAQYSCFTLRKIATNEWIAAGELSA